MVLLHCWAISNFPWKRLLYSRRKNDSVLDLLFPCPADGVSKRLLRRAIVRGINQYIIARSRLSTHVGDFPLGAAGGGY